MELLNDINGKPSSKRIVAFSGVVVMAVVSIIAIISDPSQASTVIWPWAAMIGAAIGVTVLEKK